MAVLYTDYMNNSVSAYPEAIIQIAETADIQTIEDLNAAYKQVNEIDARKIGAGGALASLTISERLDPESVYSRLGTEISSRTDTHPEVTYTPRAAGHFSWLKFFKVK